MGHTVCDHEWIEYYDAAADAACYNDGFNYRPSEYICTKCKKTKKIKYEDGMKWYKNLFLLPFSMVVLLYLVIVAQVIMFIGLIKDE